MKPSMIDSFVDVDCDLTNPILLMSMDACFESLQIDIELLKSIGAYCAICALQLVLAAVSS